VTNRSSPPTGDCCASAQAYPVVPGVCRVHGAVARQRPRSRDDSSAASSHGGPAFCLGAERGGDVELGSGLGDRGGGVAGVGTPGAAATDRSTGCTCCSGRATGSFGLERGHC
jgi:hypothetical protein